MSNEKKSIFSGLTVEDWIIGFFTGWLWIFYKMYKNGSSLGKSLGIIVGFIIVVALIYRVIYNDEIELEKKLKTPVEKVYFEYSNDSLNQLKELVSSLTEKEKKMLITIIPTDKHGSTKYINELKDKTADNILEYLKSYVKEKAEAERLAKEKAEAERIAKEESNKKVAQITTHKIDGYMFVVAAHYDNGSKDVLGIDEKCGYQLSEYKSENDEKESKMFLLKMENAYISIWPTNVYVGCEYGEKCAKSKNFITDEIKTESVLHNKFPLDKKAVRKLSDAIELCQQYGFKHKRFEDYTQYFR